MAITFDPHPAALLAPSLAPRLLQPLCERLASIAASGVSACLVHPFDRGFAELSARQYVQEILIGALRAQHVVVGRGFTFGYRQQGTTALLAEMGLETHVVEPVKVDGIVASSTKIREFVQRGLVVGARRLLGRPFTLYGRCVRGAGRGRSIGVPTANLEVDNELLPAGGVYAVQAHQGGERHVGVTNIGVSPTFDGRTLRVETHLIDFRGGDLYGKPMQLDFIDRVRDERRFDGIDALRVQITADIESARGILRG